MGILGGFTMIIDNVYVFTPDKAFVKGGIILDGDKIRQVYEEKDAPQLNGGCSGRKRLLRHSGTDRSAFSWMQGS